MIMITDSMGFFDGFPYKFFEYTFGKSTDRRRFLLLTGVP
jgi:hypothetical protein